MPSMWTMPIMPPTKDKTKAGSFLLPLSWASAQETRWITIIHTLLFKSVGFSFVMFFILLQAPFIWPKIQENSNIVKYYNLKYLISILIYFSNLVKNVMHFCDGKTEFTTAWILQSSVSHDLQKSLICWFGAQETSLIIINILWKPWSILTNRTTFIWSMYFL